MYMCDTPTGLKCRVCVCRTPVRDASPCEGLVYIVASLKLWVGIGLHCPGSPDPEPICVQQASFQA